MRTSHGQLGEKLFERDDLDPVESLPARPEEHHNPAGDLPRAVGECGETLEISCIDLSRRLDFDGPQVAADRQDEVDVGATPRPKMLQARLRPERAFPSPELEAHQVLQQ
jgi:hypothetical protein